MQETRDEGSIPGSGRFPGGGNGNPLQYSCLESPWTAAGRLQSTGSQESDTTELIARTPAVSASKVTALPGRLMDVFLRKVFLWIPETAGKSLCTSTFFFFL